MRAHQPGQHVFRSVLPEDIDWKPFPGFPPAARLAVVVGGPSGPGPYVIRVMVPAGVKLMPHEHPENRVYTVISGVFYIGLGTGSTRNNFTCIHRAPSSCSLAAHPISTGAKSGAYVTQVSAIGPLDLKYLDPSYDPRNGCRTASRGKPGDVGWRGRYPWFEKPARGLGAGRVLPRRLCARCEE